MVSDNALAPDYYIDRMMSTMTPNAARTLKYHEVEVGIELSAAIEREAAFRLEVQQV